MDSQQAIGFILDLFAALPWWAIFLAVVFGISVVALIVGASIFLRAYFQQLGTLQAQAVTLDQVVKDLKVTTSAVKAIESDIEFRSWHAKEENALRREKLEELLKAGLGHFAWAKDYATTSLFTIEDTKESPFEPILESCVELYFPELRDAAKEFTRTVGHATIHAGTVRGARMQRFQQLPRDEQLKWYPDWNARCPPTDEERAAFFEAMKNALEKLVVFKGACGDLMRKLRPEGDRD